MQMSTDTQWQVAARAALRKQRAAWIGTILVGFAGIGLFVAGSKIDASAVQIGLMGIATIMMVGSLLWGTLIYMRVIDEQERDANLWGCYVGMTVYLTLSLIRTLADLIGSTVPINEYWTLLATMTTVLVVFAWKRFR